jgi:hypothetical protein
VYALVLAVGLTGTLGPMAAVALGIGSNIFVAMRMLNWRVQGRRPETGPLLWGVATVLVGVLGLRLIMGQVPPAASIAVPTAICSLYAALIALDMRANIATLRRREEAQRAPEPVPAAAGVTEHGG